MTCRYHDGVFFQMLTESIDSIDIKNWTEKEQLSLQSSHSKNKAKDFDKKKIKQSLTPKNMM